MGVPSGRRWWCALVGVALSAFAAAESAAQVVNRPSAANRVVRHFDFDERETNPLPVPAGWYRGQADVGIGRVRPGFPVWNQASLDYAAPARSGDGTVRLDTQGGSTSLVLSSGVIPVFPGADYLVGGDLRTEGLTRARARLGARFLAQDGSVIEGTEVWTDAVITGGAWRSVSVAVPGDAPDAAFLQLELQVVQPGELQGSTGESFEIRREDIRGSAWFDDVTVVQTPSVRFTTSRVGGVYHSGERPALHIAVRDLAGQETTLRASVHDAEGRLVAVHEFDPRLGYADLVWKPTLAERFGWYRATLELRAGENLVGGASTTFVWINPPERSGSAGGPAFGLVLERPDLESVHAARAVAEATAIGSVTLPVWWNEGFEPEAAAAVGNGVSALLRDELDVGLVFDRLPADVARAMRLHPLDVADAFAAGGEPLYGVVDPYLQRYGQRVLRWQLGAGSGDRSQSGSSSTVLAAAGATLGRLVPVPEVVVPTAFDTEGGASVPGVSRAVRVPASAAPEGIEEMLRTWIDHASASGPLDAASVDGGILADRSGGLRFVLEPLRSEVFGESAAAADLARRVLTLWGVATDTDRLPGERVALDLAGPFERSRAPRRAPSIELAVWASMRERLSGRRAVMRFEPEPGVTALLLAGTQEGPGNAALAVWQSGPAQPRTAIMLGSTGARGIDIFGNEVELEVDSGAPGTPTFIPVSPEPVFVEGVNAELLMFLASVRLEPGMIAARGTRARHEVVFENPWASSIRGRVRVLEPGGYTSPDGELDRSWNISPRTLSFAAEAGQEVRLAVDIGFSRGEFAGPKPLVLDIELQAEGVAATFRHEGVVEFGLPELEITVSPTTGDGRDMGVRAEITNVSNELLNVELTTAAIGFPRSSVSISGLAPGETVVRRFSFPEGLDALVDSGVVVVVLVPDVDGRLAHYVRPPGTSE